MHYHAGINSGQALHDDLESEDRSGIDNEVAMAAMPPCPNLKNRISPG